MKPYIFSLLFLFSLSCAGQIQFSDLGLPEDMTTLQNCVITAQKVNTIRVSSTSVTVRSTAPGFSQYALNFIHSYVHEFDFEYVGVSNGLYKFVKPSVTFYVNGVKHTADAQELLIWQELQGRWVFKVKSYPSTYTYIQSGQFITLTAEQVANRRGVSLDTLYELDSDYYYGFDKSPATHVTSVFVTVSQSGNLFTGQVWVNLKPSTGYTNLIGSYGKTGASYVVKWKRYNGCTYQTAISGGYEKGNFGLCESRGPSPAGSEQHQQVFSFDLTQEYAVVECQIEERQADGKTASFSGYYTIRGCDHDDPCGPARRLPRKPIN